MEDQTLKFLLKRDQNAALPLLCPCSLFLGRNDGNGQATPVNAVSMKLQNRMCRSSGECSSVGGTDSRDVSNVAEPLMSLHWRDGYDHHQEGLRHTLWEKKDLFNTTNIQEYITARDRVFPFAKSGGNKKQFFNRAGYKLSEVMEAVGLWEHLTSLCKASSSSTTSGKVRDEEQSKGLSASDGLLNSSLDGKKVKECERENTCLSLPLPSGAHLSSLASTSEAEVTRKRSRSNTVGVSLVASAFKRLLAAEKSEKSIPLERSNTSCLESRKLKKSISHNIVTFVDLCGGPGSFAQYLCAEGSRRRFLMRGVGMTLGGVEGLDWYPELTPSLQGKASSFKTSSFSITYGPDGTGNIFELQNVNGLVSITGANKVALVVADGGFSVAEELQNYQETISSRITYSQWFAALKLQSSGGCFVLKLFDTFSPFTRAMLYLSTFLYRHVWIVKPKHSRLINSERYLVCVDFESQSFSCAVSSNAQGRNCPASLSSKWMSHLERCFLKGFQSDEYCVPTFLLSPEVVTRDTVFMKDLYEMNKVLGSHQIEGLQLVSEEILREKEKTITPEHIEESI